MSLFISYSKSLRNSEWTFSAVFAMISPRLDRNEWAIGDQICPARRAVKRIRTVVGGPSGRCLWSTWMLPQFAKWLVSTVNIGISPCIFGLWYWDIFGSQDPNLRRCCENSRFAESKRVLPPATDRLANYGDSKGMGTFGHAGGIGNGIIELNWCTIWLWLRVCHGKSPCY